MSEFDFDSLVEEINEEHRARLRALTLLAEIGVFTMVAAEERLLDETQQLLDDIEKINTR